MASAVGEGCNHQFGSITYRCFSNWGLFFYEDTYKYYNNCEYFPQFCDIL
jgi:hypothetical protein